MNFIETIIQLFFNIGDFIGSIFSSLIDFLALPFALLLQLLEGIFYFIVILFQVVIKIVQIFVALFQFFFSVVSALFISIGNMVGFAPTGELNLNYATRIGFDTALEQIGGTGLLTVVPNVLIAIMWIWFAIKVIGKFTNGSEQN